MADEKVFPKSSGDIAYASEFNAIKIVNLVTGENVTAGNVVYINKNDSKVYISDTGTANDIRADGIALTTATSGNTTHVQLCGNYVTSGLTANTVYYLGASGAVSTTQSGVEVGVATATTNLFIDIRQDDHDAVGTIKAWNKSATGMPSNVLTAFWLECAGAAISDNESPFDGQNLPDLNSTQRFLRGNTTSETTGGADTHLHVISSLTQAGVAGADFNTFPISGGTQSYNSDNASTLPAHMEVVWIMKIK